MDWLQKRVRSKTYWKSLRSEHKFVDQVQSGEGKAGTAKRQGGGMTEMVQVRRLCWQERLPKDNREAPCLKSARERHQCLQCLQ